MGRGYNEDYQGTLVRIMVSPRWKTEVSDGNWAVPEVKSGEYWFKLPVFPKPGEFLAECGKALVFLSKHWGVK